MPSLLAFVRRVDALGQDLHQHVTAAKAESGRVRRHARGRAFEFVGEDRAARGDGGLHRGD